MKNIILSFVLMIWIFGCSKPFELTDPLTGNPPAAVSSSNTSVCVLSNVRQIDRGKVYDGLNIQRDLLLNTTQIAYYDSVLKRSETLTFKMTGDTVYINPIEYIVLSKKEKNIMVYSFREYAVDSSFFDAVKYEYTYDANGYLISKKKIYNNASEPFLITNYNYTSGNLTSLAVFLGNTKVRLMESFLKYDEKVKIKPWIYSFTDSFESYLLLYGFSFGQSNVNPLSEINTILYDVNTRLVLDMWSTQYGSYVISPDAYVLQVTASGDIQQGLWPGFAGTMRFEYKCK